MHAPFLRICYFFTDIKLEPDNDSEDDDCPLNVPAKYKTGTKEENPTAPKLHPRRLKYEETKADVDVENIKLGKVISQYKQEKAMVST